MMKWILLFFIKCYKAAISPFIGHSCRFFPTCSEYALQAIEKHGACKGALLAVQRIAKCHPFHSGGCDPVP
ncbi:MAG TPA: membrane protein insertion efficiency factor YidD [Chlamydiales bacterium]|nr:membrane protein insertion efficiency factor YidD [Chlamydiales bacterium]